MIDSLKSPTLLLNKEIALQNIQNMAEKASLYGLKFRPHFKTHQSLEIGNWFRDFEIDGITVSSLKMAQYFADDGWQSITVAFPVNLLEAKEINDLANKIDLRVLVVSLDTLKALQKLISAPLNIYIEINPGYGRSGVSLTDYKTIGSLIENIQRSKNFIFSGFYTHAGHSYNSRSVNELTELAVGLIEELGTLISHYNYPVCFGDTPSCSILKEFGDVTEISPGNFVFYDWIQTKIGSCLPEDIAVAMACPVVAKYESRNELLIHGGAVHFSKDFDFRQDGTPYFGQVVSYKNGTWSSVIKDCYLKSISQEHGILSCTSDFFNKINISDFVGIYPIHSCLTADLMGRYLTIDGEEIDHLSKNYK